MAENKTAMTGVPVSEYLTTVEARRIPEAEHIITVMRNISGLDPRMWGPSIIGFGSSHYRYESGHEGDQPIIAFSPRKANLVFYFSPGFFERHQALLQQLGKHRTSVACLYVTRLANIRQDILEKLLEQNWRESCK